MKIRITLFFAGMLVLAAAGAHAQEFDASRVKILPALSPGSLKLHYALPVEEPVYVRFYRGTRTSTTDRIIADAPKGISKIYDVRSISGSDFWMEVRTSQMQLIYRVTPQEGGKRFSPFLEKATYQYQPLVKAGN